MEYQDVFFCLEEIQVEFRNVFLFKMRFKWNVIFFSIFRGDSSGVSKRLISLYVRLGVCAVGSGRFLNDRDQRHRGCWNMKSVG